MKVIWALFIVIIFMAELTLDTSTIFVRRSSGAEFVSKNPLTSSDSSNTHSPVEPHKKKLESGTHVALPQLLIIYVVEYYFEHENILPDVVFPQLDPPVYTIKRPPISQALI